MVRETRLSICLTFNYIPHVNLSARIFVRIESIVLKDRINPVKADDEEEDAVAR